MKLKKTKIYFSVIILATLLIAMIYNSKARINEVSETEFLFDTPCTIAVFKNSEKSAVAEAFNEAARIHKLSDFFDSSSDVSKINIAKAGIAVKVDPCIIEMLDLADQIYDSSNGAFDISIARVMRLWDFGAENPVPPTEEDIKEARLFSGKGSISLDKTAYTVTKKYDQTQIDLGGIAKGYAADRASKVLRKMNVKSAIIDFGGNLITIGENPKTKDGMWRIGLQKPFSPSGEYVKTISIGTKAVATSGSYQRNFVYDGELYHHIIDPKTGKPARQDFQSVTVVASNSALADALGTAIFVLGRKEGKNLAEKFNAEVVFLE